MHSFLRPHIRVRQQGQTLIIALIVLGVLLILGLVFLGVINRNILNAARGQRRSAASDLAEAGVRYAHGQLVSSPLGADWRGTPTIVAAMAASPDLTGDPDAYYLRPGNYGNATAQKSGIANDLGGPDGLGPYVRLRFPDGRALVRVRWGATDANPAATAGGPLRNPGAARSTLIIESIGRPGVVADNNDPTTFNVAGGVKFKNFTNQAELSQNLTAMAKADSQVATSRRLVAFAPIGIIDAARFETNVFNSSAPIDLGIPDGLGVQAFNDVTGVGLTDVGTSLEMLMGTPTDVKSAGVNQGRYGGSLIANSDVRVFGTLHTYLNRALGDGIRVAGRVIAGTPGAKIQITASDYVNGAYTTATDLPALTDGGASSFDSQDPSFDTEGGLLLDGSQRSDAAGYSSGVGRIVPPSTQTIDPETKLNRYVSMTRGTGGSSAAGAEAGAFGHGEGVYVDNAADRQEGADAASRQAAGSQVSLFDDWLNPNNGNSGTGWKGPFYVPPAAVVQLLPDGFAVQRSDATWKTPAGGDSTLKTIRYRIGLGTDGGLRILDTLSSTFNGNTQAINGTLSKADFDNGMPFNGVLYFEGNVRVRGTIPTGVQLTLVSGATIYIDGSILKGTTGNEVVKSQSGARDEPIGGLPTASLMMMARDNVAVNTTMFVGPAAGQVLDSFNDQSGATSVSPVSLGAVGGSEAGRLDLVTELALDANDPATGDPLTSAVQWRPYVLNYTPFDSNTNLSTQLLTAYTMAPGTGSAAIFSMDVNYGGGTPATTEYQFDAVDPGGLMTNTAAVYTGQDGTPGATLPLYGIGSEEWQKYSKFEGRGFTVVPSPASKSYSTTGAITGTGMNPLYSGGNDFRFQPGSLAGVSTNDTLIARAALVPGDVRIEASVFAEQGSFFIIPGPWFNPNPNDTHAVYAQRVRDLQTNDGLTVAQAKARADRERLENNGMAPAVPFYGEPVDVKLTVVGSVAENLPPPISVQAEWIRKWSWIPRRLGATGVGIPKQHTPYLPGQAAAKMANQNFVPNLIIQYDPILATGRLNSAAQATIIRTDTIGRPLPPMPRLPVSPKLAYFGELR